MNFDPEDPINQGRPHFFDPDHYLDSVEQVIMADELQFAMTMLDNMPGWYRDNEPTRAKEIRRKLLKNLWLPSQYSNDPYEISPSVEKIKTKIETLFCHPRAEMVVNTVREYNEKGISPLIIELGPADYWLPVGLAGAQLKFRYHDINMNRQAKDFAVKTYPEVPWSEVTDGPYIFCCFEVLEHMLNPEELFLNYEKIGIDADVIMLSTPKYTMGGGLDNWDSRELGHVRTWTPDEFIAFAKKYFKGYGWGYAESFSMFLMGKR
jgi:hypothetical protein